MKNKYITTRIKKIIKETNKISTYILDIKINAYPGQYVMLWIPGINEKPFSIAKNNPLTLTIANVGLFTQAVSKYKVGDLVSFRGPFGKGFEIPIKNNTLLVGGGYGVVPLYFLASEIMRKDKRKVSVIIGAKNKQDLIYYKRFIKLGCSAKIATDDGSKGFKGYSTDLAEKLIKKQKFSYIATCGPEIMMKKIALLALKHKIKCQVSLERKFKCGGMGICGECSINGILVCKDGPVFDSGILISAR